MNRFKMSEEGIEPWTIWHQCVEGSAAGLSKAPTYWWLWVALLQAQIESIDRTHSCVCSVYSRVNYNNLTRVIQSWSQLVTVDVFYSISWLHRGTFYIPYILPSWLALAWLGWLARWQFYLYAHYRILLLCYYRGLITSAVPYTFPVPT